MAANPTMKRECMLAHRIISGTSQRSRFGLWRPSASTELHGGQQRERRHLGADEKPLVDGGRHPDQERRGRHRPEEAREMTGQDRERRDEARRLTR